MRVTIFFIIMISSIFAGCGLFLGIGPAEAFDDGFVSLAKIESRYFTIYTEGGVDIEGLASRISIPSSIAAIIKAPVSISASSSDIADQVDLLYLAVSEIMDVKVKNFKCNLKICRDTAGLSAVANKLFGREIQTGGFYVVDLDTLYVDAENISINILGHELSHAIQTHYFVVPPSVKIQEVLAGYVEFQLRKYTNSLPR